MSDVVVFPDAEAAVHRYLKATAAAEGVTVGVTTQLPGAAPTSPMLVVQWDGTPVGRPPVTMGATIRVTCHAPPGRPSDAKLHAARALAWLLTHPGDDEVEGCTFLTGVLPARDPDNGAELASVTVRANLRPPAAD